MSDDPPGPWWQRLLWFWGIWAASILVLALVAYGIRWMLK